MIYDFLAGIHLLLSHGYSVELKTGHDVIYVGYESDLPQEVADMLKKHGFLLTENDGWVWYT